MVGFLRIRPTMRMRSISWNLCGGCLVELQLEKANLQSQQYNQHSAQFELVEFSNRRIKKCAAGCKGNIRDGPDKFSSGEIDDKYCICHKEHDFVWIASHNKYKKNF